MGTRIDITSVRISIKKRKSSGSAVLTKFDTLLDMHMYDVDVCLIRRHLGSSTACFKLQLAELTRKSPCRSTSCAQVLSLVLPAAMQARVLLNYPGRNLQLQHLPLTSWRVYFFIASVTKRRTFPTVTQVRAPLKILKIHCWIPRSTSSAQVLRSVLPTAMQVRAPLKYPARCRELQQQLPLTSAMQVQAPLEFPSNGGNPSVQS